MPLRLGGDVRPDAREKRAWRFLTPSTGPPTHPIPACSSRAHMAAAALELWQSNAHVRWEQLNLDARLSGQLTPVGVAWLTAVQRQLLSQAVRYAAHTMRASPSLRQCCRYMEKSRLPSRVQKSRKCLLHPAAK